MKYSIQVELALRDDGYLVGDNLTGADFMMCFPLYLADQAGFFPTRPKIRAYVQRLLDRPAFKAAIQDTEDLLETLFLDPELKSFRVPEAQDEFWK